MLKRLTLCWRVLRLPEDECDELADELENIRAFYATTHSPNTSAPTQGIIGKYGESRTRDEFSVDWDYFD